MVSNRSQNSSGRKIVNFYSLHLPFQWFSIFLKISGFQLSSMVSAALQNYQASAWFPSASEIYSSRKSGYQSSRLAILSDCWDNSCHQFTTMRNHFKIMLSPKHCPSYPNIGTAFPEHLLWRWYSDRTSQILLGIWLLSIFISAFQGETSADRAFETR